MSPPGMDPKYTADSNRPGDQRLPGFGWLPNRIRHLVIACIGEFVGTFLFLFFAFAATQVANNLLGKTPMNLGALLYISLAFGMSLAVNVWVFFRISGGLFNPAVTVALGLVGAINWLKAAVLIFWQILGGIAAAALVSGLFPGPLTVRTSLGAGTSVVRGLFIEMILTFELIFCIFMLAAEKHRATFIAPLGIGLALFIAELAGVLFTGGSLNPARSFGPDVVLRTFDNYHWIYWVGPLLGAILAALFYRLMKVVQYESVSPDADSDGREYHGKPKDMTASTDYDNSRAATRHTTDGTDETDCAPHRVTNKQNPVMPVRTTMSSHANTISMEPTAYNKPHQPVPAFLHGGDGHRSDSFLDHPNDRPRAHHPRSSRRSSHSHYEMPPSDYSYRSGPDAESSRSSQ